MGYNLALDIKPAEKWGGYHTDSEGNKTLHTRTADTVNDKAGYHISEYYDIAFDSLFPYVSKLFYEVKTEVEEIGNSDALLINEKTISEVPFDSYKKIEEFFENKIQKNGYLTSEFIENDLFIANYDYLISKYNDKQVYDNKVVEQAIKSVYDETYWVWKEKREYRHYTLYRY